MSGLSQYAFRIISRRRLHLVSYRLSPKKVGLAGATPPVNLDTVKPGKPVLENISGPSGQHQGKEKINYTKYFLVALCFAGALVIIQVILVPALGKSVGQ